MNPYTLFFGYRFVFGFSSEGEHKVRPYIGFGHWLDFGIFSSQHFPLTCTYALTADNGFQNRPFKICLQSNY